MSTSPKTSQHRVRIQEAEEDVVEEYYKRNQLPDAHQVTFQPIPRTISANRFQVCEVDSLKHSTNSSSLSSQHHDHHHQREFDKSFYWLAMRRKRFGFRYLALCTFAILYTLLGATVFFLIEGSHEKSQLKIRASNLDRVLDHMASVLSEAVNDPNKTSEHQRMKDFIRSSYIELQKQEEQYKWSTYYRLENENNLKWSFYSAFFFSMNVYTTTGYGSISAQTVAGQFFTMIYAFCFVPMTLVILRDLGQMFLVNFTKLYAYALSWRSKAEDDDEMIQLPVAFCMGILVVYLIFCTLFVFFYDALMGPEFESGLNLFTAFYFSFISLTTIGLGDVMPNNVPYAPPVSILFFIGMAVTKVVNRSTYIAVENGVFGIMTMAETWIDKKVREPDIKSTDSDSDNDSVNHQIVNNFTVRSVATFMKSNTDIYGGGFGRVQLRRGDLRAAYRHTVAAVSTAQF